MGEEFKLSQQKLEIELPGIVDSPDIPKGSIFTVALNLGGVTREIPAVGNVRRDTELNASFNVNSLIPGYKEYSEMFGEIGLPKTKKIYTFRKLRDSVMPLLGAKGIEPPVLDSDVQKFIDEAAVTLERGRDGSLNMSFDVLNREVYDSEGNLVYSPDQFVFKTEGVQGLEVSAIEGSVYQDGKRVANIGRPDVVVDEAKEALAEARLTEKTPTTPAATEQLSTPESEVEQPAPTPTATQPPEAPPEEPMTPGESREMRAEEIQPAFSIVFAPDTLVYSKEGDRVTVDAVSYDTSINMRIPKAWVREGGGEQTVEIDLGELAGARIGIDGYEEYGNLTLQIPEDPEEIKNLDQTLSLSEAIAEVDQSLPVDEINARRDSLLRVSETRGFRAAVRAYAEYLSSEHGAGDPSELEAAIMRNSGGKVVEEAIDFANRMADNYAGQLPAEFRPRVAAALRSVEVGARDSDNIDAVINDVESRLLAEAAPYSGFVPELGDGIRTKIGQLRKSLFAIVVPTLPHPGELPDHLPTQIEVGDGKMRIPVNEQRRTIGLAFDLPEDMEDVRLTGGIVGNENLRFSFDLQQEE